MYAFWYVPSFTFPPLFPSIQLPCPVFPVFWLGSQENFFFWVVQQFLTPCHRFLQTKTPYLDAITQTLQRGGDTDTNACIVGGLIGALWGTDGIPENMKVHDPYLPYLHPPPFLTCSTSTESSVPLLSVQLFLLPPSCLVSGLLIFEL